MENVDFREDPGRFVTGARSVIVVAMTCCGFEVTPGSGECRVARFALTQDYHRVMTKRLKLLLKDIQDLVPCRGRVAVDSHPLLERALAERSGIGWIGKNSCLISQDRSSWLLLGELVLDVELEHDRPHPNRCGTCEECMRACPTGAIVEPGVVDSNRCVSYLTIENAGPIPRHLRSLVGDRLFGCDSCQEACSWSRSCRTDDGIIHRRMTATPSAVSVLDMTEQEFTDRFSGTPIMRAGWSLMARNAAVVLGNIRPPEGLASLARAFVERESLVRRHAAWALGRYGAIDILGGELERESSEEVRAEIVQALAD